VNKIMKYKIFHELSNADIKVLNNIAGKVGFGVKYVELQYVHWNLDLKVDQILREEFEKAFLGGDASKSTYNQLFSDISKKYKPRNAAKVKRAFEKAFLSDLNFK